MINFYAAEHHISNGEAISQVADLYGVELTTKKFKRSSRSSRQLSSHVETFDNQAEIEIIANDIIFAAGHLRETDYFSKRGISFSTAEKYKCSYIEKWTHPKKRDEARIYPSPRVIIPTSSESYVARSTDDNDVPKMKAGVGSIFNLGILESSRQHVVIVEGEIDALSIIEAGNDAIALGSTNNVDKLISWLEEKNIRPHLPLVLNLDADEAGKKAADKLASELVFNFTA